MADFTSTPYDWLRQVPLALKEWDEVPLWGNYPEFPWDKFSQEFGTALKLNTCTISPVDISWREPTEIKQRINENPFSLPFALNPLHGHGYLLFAHAEIDKFLHLLLHTKDNIPLLEKDFIRGFTHFLGLQIINVFQTTGFEKTFTPQLLSLDELPEEPCMCIDIALKMEDHEIHTTLCISNLLRTSIKEYFTKKAAASPNKLYNKLEITLQLVAGSTTIAQKEWNNCLPGDFIVLDSCSLELGQNKGRVMLTLNDLPIFRGKIKDGSIKILEYPLFHEVQNQMNPKDYDEDEESEFEDESSTEDSEEEDLEEEYSDDGEYTDDDQFSEEEEYEDSEIEEDDEDEDLHSNELSSQIPSQKKEEAVSKTAPSKIEQKTDASTKNLIKAEDIPLTISIEVGRVQMTMQKLSELAPGNLLELDVHPENGVDLVVNGRCIGKGELLRIGDVLGVRILDKV